MCAAHLACGGCLRASPLPPLPASSLHDASFPPPSSSSSLQRPSAVQARAIGPLMRGRDLIVQSQSGTGKTAVFSIGILQVIDAKAKG